MNEIIIPYIEYCLNYLLTKINSGEYKEVYIILAMSFASVLFLIWGLSWFFSTQKIRSEQRKENEERKAKQIENYNELGKVKKEYEENLKMVQIATSDIINAFSMNDAELIRKNIKDTCDFIFNVLLLSFEEYLDIYEIIYENKTNRFYNLYHDDYKTLLCNIIEIVKIINNDEVLKKTNLEKYKIYPYALNGIYNFMNYHFYFFDIPHKIENYIIRKRLLDIGK